MLRYSLSSNMYICRLYKSPKFTKTVYRDRPDIYKKKKVTKEYGLHEIITFILFTSLHENVHQSF